MVALLLATSTAFAVVPARALPVPGREGVSSLLWPLVPVLPALTVPGSAASARRDLERTGGRSQVALRAWFVAIVTAATGLACLAGIRFDLLIVWRNAAFMLGLTLACASVSPRGAWLPAVVVPMLMWLVGTQPGGIVEPWALLLLPGSSTTATWASGLAWAVGFLAYTSCGSGAFGMVGSRIRNARRA
ncbi:MAG TPA: hypothetical protein VNO79_07575 [Actinomycetota bacterium]|nr:hypothetical protein [Actinomycetota bacterium]